jgi:hypothetical protein
MQILRDEVDETENIQFEVLALARKISSGTIDKILGQSDFEVALARQAAWHGARVDRNPSCRLWHA